MSASNQMSFPPMVETPFDFSWIFDTGFLETRLPREVFPLIARVEKSYSSCVFLSFGRGRS